MGAVCATGGVEKRGEEKDLARQIAGEHVKGRKGKGTMNTAGEEMDADARPRAMAGETPSDQLVIGTPSKHRGEKPAGGKVPRLPAAVEALDEAARQAEFQEEAGITQEHQKARKGKRRGSMNRQRPSVWGAAERAAYEADGGTAHESLTARLGKGFGTLVGGGRKGEEAAVAQQKRLCDVCANWLPDECTCGKVVEKEKWISSDSEEEEEDVKHLTVKEREKLRRKKKDKGKVAMSRGGTRVKAQRSIEEIRAQAEEREHEAALLYNQSSAAANALGTPAGPKIAVNPNPRLVQAMEAKKKKASHQGGGGGFRMPPGAAKEDPQGQESSGRRSKLQPGMLGGSRTALTYQRPTTPPGGWASQNTFKIPNPATPSP